MDEQRKKGYRVLVAAVLFHLRVDLACVLSGLSWLSWLQPRRFGWQMRAVRTAAYRAYAFHNLAIFAAHDFDGFVEDQSGAMWSGSATSVQLIGISTAPSSTV